MGAVPVLGLTRAKSAGGEWEAPALILDSFSAVQKEGTLSLVESAPFSTEYEGAKFEGRMDIFEKNLLIF